MNGERRSRSGNGTVIYSEMGFLQTLKSFRQKSLVAGVCEGVITGLGALGYELALMYFYNKFS